MRLDLSDKRLSYPLIGLALMAPLLWRVYWPAGNGLDVAGHQIGRDFIGLWAGPQLAFSGKLWTLFDPQAFWDELNRLFGQPIPFHNWGYPLFTLALFWPLAQLPYFWAVAIWVLGSFAVLAAVVVPQVAPERRLAALAVLALSPACLMNAVGGQNGFVSAALLIGGMLALDRRPILAGVLFGLLTFKPHLGLVLPFVLLALGAWRTIAAAVVTAALLVGGSVLQLGLEPWRQYLTVTTAYQTSLLIGFEGYYTLMMTSVLAGARTLGISYHSGLAIQAAVALTVLPVAVMAIVRTSDPYRRIAVLVPATLLVTPYAFNYDMTALAAVIVWTLFGRLPSREAWSLAYLAGWATPVATIFIANVGAPLGPPAILAMLALGVREALDGQPLLPARVPDWLAMLRRRRMADAHG